MSGDKQTIVITGATGFTGLHACRYALDSGMHVVSIGRTPCKINPSITNLECDITNLDQVSSCIKDMKPDYILHLAGCNNVKHSWTDPLQFLETNVLGTANLLESIRTHAPYARTVIIGSALEYSLKKNEKPIHPYSLSKTLQILLTEGWNDLFSMDLAIVRPSNLIGPGPSFGICSKIAAEIVQSERNFGSVNLQIQNMWTQCDFVDVRDAVRAYFKILQSNTDIDHFEIGSGMSRRLEDLIDEYKKLTSRPFSILEQVRKETTEIRLDLVPIQTLGWCPHYTIQQSLQDILSYQRSINAN
ncbi:NAD(P)-dependent oxidoreductase [Alkalihalobacillus sp. AL-G]|uniref:NAD-dependent epimerase/dehydratase family protein n=1 Tax=Alkalihalobacillus sp. AL-G TaxID=2926399 RepID=UPI00272BB664|nr:NAD-dependent epimerase/dehydratase family protein [Alkalihalobacillus sp. AL-G]WLD94955.1 NAD-dependent epimerase/dehydratase family protein [Alkalihalobacillus sp. AL-G]